MMPDFTVVIPAYNEGAQVLRTMRALGASFEGSYTPEVVVVDDHSTDNTHELAHEGARELKATGLAVEVVRAPRRSGVAGAKNIGQAQATTPVTFFLDAHSVPGRGSIERVVEPLLNREAAIAGPTFVALPEPTQKELLVGQFDDVSPEAYELTNIVERVDATGAGYGRGMVFRDHSMLLDWMTFRVADRGLQRVMIVPGGCCGVRTDEHGPNVFDGLFDTGFSFPWGAEDAELCLRVWRLGHVVASVPGAFVATEFRSSFRFGTAAAGHMFNALRLSAIYFSPDVFSQTVRHYIGDEDVGWVLAELLYNSDIAERRGRLKELGPPGLRDLIPVVQEFGGLNVVTGNDRHLIDNQTAGIVGA